MLNVIEVKDKQHMASSRFRQPSFLTFTNTREEEDLPSTSGVGVRSRLPASAEKVSHSDIIDLTPSGEVQMRVMGSHTLTDECTPRMSNRNENAEGQSQSTNLSYEQLRHEIAEHKEAERRIRGLLESHFEDESRVSCGGGDGIKIDKVFPGLSDVHERRQQADLRGPHVDQCYGPSTNPSWQAHPNMLAGECGSVQSRQLSRNGCVDTMTSPDIMNDFSRYNEH